MSSKIRIIFFSCVFCSFFLQVSCASKQYDADPPTKISRKKSPSTSGQSPIQVQVLTRKVSRNVPEKFRDGLNHPFSFSESEMCAILQSIYYSEWDRFGIFGKPKPVFSENVSRQLAVDLSNTFKKAKIVEAVHFNVVEGNSKTMGFAFIAGETMYWDFNWINGLSYDYKDPYKRSWEKDENQLPNWRLEPQKGQKLFTEAGIISKYQQGDFLMVRLSYYKVAGLKGGGGEPGQETGPEGKTQENEKGSVLERYQDLKKMKKDRLISENDYQRKAKALMAEKRSLSVPDELKLLNLFRMDGLITEDEFESNKKSLLERL
ncbi:MAG: hypothetical protein HZA01_14615 [Nitrospinae bacterium]|nr:hypothetical protein [Nitrospinota bacterium]